MREQVFVQYKNLKRYKVRLWKEVFIWRQALSRILYASIEALGPLWCFSVKAPEILPHKASPLCSLFIIYYSLLFFIFILFIYINSTCTVIIYVHVCLPPCLFLEDGLHAFFVLPEHSMTPDPQELFDQDFKTNGMAGVRATIY